MWACIRSVQCAPHQQAERGGGDAAGLQRWEPRQAIPGGTQRNCPEVSRRSSELVKGRHLTVFWARKFTSRVHVGSGRMFSLLRCDQLDDLGKEQETVKSAHLLLFFLLLALRRRRQI